MIIDGFWGSVIGFLLCFVLGVITLFIYCLIEIKRLAREAEREENKDGE